MDAQILEIILKTGNSGIGATGLIAALYWYVKNRMDKQASKIEKQELTNQLQETKIELNNQRLEYHSEYNQILTDRIEENSRQINELSKQTATILALARRTKS